MSERMTIGPENAFPKPEARDPDEALREREDFEAAYVLDAVLHAMDKAGLSDENKIDALRYAEQANNSEQETTQLY